MKNLAMGDGGEGGTRIHTPLYGGLFSSPAGTAVPFVLPGERVEVTPELKILEPAATRIAPRCIHFGTCGGCHYQHAAYPAQLELKCTILGNLLDAAGLVNRPAIHTVSGDPWHYRNRIRLRIEPAPYGGFHAGYNLRNANQFLPITMCPISAALLWNAAEAILNLAANPRGADPLVSRWLAITSELELFCTPDQDRLQLQFFLRTADGALREASSFSGLCDRILAAVPQLAGAGAVLDPELDRRARRRWDGIGWRAAGFNYPAAGHLYWLPRGAFFQVNRFLVDDLVRLVSGGQAGDIAWDLYAGVGLFTRALADTFRHVVAVEGAAAAVVSLDMTVKSRGAKAGPGTMESVHSSTLDFLRARELQRERPDLIVLDPPRAGIGPEAAAILARLAVPRIVYVSCDPTTLARDLAILVPAYKIDAIHLVDLFPQTFHLETVVHLSAAPH